MATTGRLTGASMTHDRVQPSGATTAAGLGRRIGGTATHGRRSGAMIGPTRLDHQVTVKVSARMGRREAATDLRTHPVVAIGVRMHRAGVIDLRLHEGATGLRMREVATGPHMRHEDATTGPVRRFGAMTAGGDRRFAETTGRTRPAHRVTVTVNMTTGATARRGEAIVRRTHREAAAPDRSRLGRAARDPAAPAGTTTRVRCGFRATRRQAAGLSRHGRVDAARRIDQEAGRRSGQDRLAARVRAANAVDTVGGQEVAVGRAVLAEGHRAASEHRGGMATQEAMRDQRGGRRIEAEGQAARRGAEADRAGRRLTRRDGLVAGRDL